MNWITQNAPFGTDNTPVLNIKIVGGKRVEVLAKQRENGDVERKEWLHVKSPPRGPNGTPSMLTQPLFHDYEYSDFQPGFSTAKQHKLAREVTSYTSPSGDRSRSFRHGNAHFNKHRILPPIGASQPPTNFVMRNDEFSRNGFKAEPSENHNSKPVDASLESLVSSQISNYKSDKIKDMYIELTGFDRHLSGFVTETQLSLVALRFDLPLKISTLKLAVRKFADIKDPTLVNYEKFLQFLSSCLSHSTKRRKKDKSNHRHDLSNYETPANDAKPEEHDKTAFVESSNVQEKLVSLLREQLGGCEEIDVPELRSALAAADRLGNHELPADIVKKVCLQQRVPLTGSVITKMLSHAEVSNGIINWIQFLELLVRAGSRQGGSPTKQSIGFTHVDGNGPSKSSLPSGNPPQSAPWEQKPLQDIGPSPSLRRDGEAELAVPTTGKHYPTNGKASNDDLSMRTTKQSRPLSLGWDERETRPAREQSETEQEVPTIRNEDWMRNFTRLAHALRSYHPFKSGVLPRDEVERMARNYNLIYNLGFTHKQLSNAITQAVTFDSAKKSDPTVSIDNLLEFLLNTSS